MDRELAAQYWRSPWSDRLSAEGQPQSRNYTCRVQSAWALTYDTIPAGFSSRCVIPVDDNLNPLPESMVLHTAGNYSLSKTHSFGTVPVEKAFLREAIASRISNLIWNMRAIVRRVLGKLARLQVATWGAKL